MELLQEPWCLSVDQVAGLTRWQVEHLYLRPAAERAKRLKRDLAGDGTEQIADIDADSLEAFVAGMEAAYPGRAPRAKWEADWNRLQLMKRGGEK